MATSTIIIEGSSTESFMLPGMASPEPDASGRLVRFDKECVLIPELVSKAKLPLVVTKSVALPLWKRRGYPTSDSEVEDPLGSSPQLASSPPEESRVVIKVPIPLYVVNHSRRYFLLIICVQIQEEVIKIADAGSISVVFAGYTKDPPIVSRAAFTNDFTCRVTIISCSSRLGFVFGLPPSQGRCHNTIACVLRSM